MMLKKRLIFELVMVKKRKYIIDKNKQDDSRKGVENTKSK